MSLQADSNSFDLSRLINRMASFSRTLQAAVDGLSEGDARWKPTGGAWSILEIVAHLADEETEDFGTRVRMTLVDPSTPWPGIDPEGWAEERKYRERVLSEEVDRFCEARRESLVFLQGLDAQTPWQNIYTQPKFGEFKAGDILASWCAHDWLHLRQIAKRHYEMAGRDAGEYSNAYAGEWGI